MCKKLTVTLTPKSSVNLSTLKDQWLTLEQVANNSIFTSWPWVSLWLEEINIDCLVTTISCNNEIVGLGFLTQHISTKNSIKFKQLWLNRTGDTKRDQIWCEFNDILCIAGREQEIRATLLHHFNRTNLADELIIGVSNIEILNTPVSPRIMKHITWKANSYSTDLKPDFADINNFLSTLSRNTEKQIKRSIKLYQQNYSISFKRANTTEMALKYFSYLAELHKQRWTDNQSGFANPLFFSFHQKLIKQYYSQGIIDLIKVSAGGNVIGYLYNFTYKNDVYFYLSGFKFLNDNRFKPGLVCHSLAIAHYSELNYKKYDFMGGESRYKQSLSNNKSEMVIVSFRRNIPSFVASNLIRQTKKKYMSLKQKMKNLNKKV